MLCASVASSRVSHRFVQCMFPNANQNLPQFMFESQILITAQSGNVRSAAILSKNESGLHWSAFCCHADWMETNPW